MSIQTVRGAAILAFIGSVTLYSQATITARLQGTVQDSTGAVVATAVVSATNDQTHIKRETVTTADGRYIFPSLEAGQYTITVEALGFRRETITEIDLTVAATLNENVTLQVGNVSESVDVKADAVTVQTSEAQASQAFTLKDIDTLPQLGRTPTSLTTLMPGVSISPGGGGNVNGLRSGSENTTLDGMYVSDPTGPSLGQALTAINTDSVEEFRMVTDGGKAEYGYNAGANIQLISRSGTNRFSGNVFEYLRNTLLNANNFFANSTGTARPKLIQNVYGGSVGGPILKARTFFFFNFQGTREDQETSTNRTVLTPTAAQGIFRWPTPGTGVIQSVNIPLIDPRHLGIDPTVAKNIALLPASNNTNVGDGLNTAGYLFNSPTNSLQDILTFKLDHNLSSTHKVFFRYNWQHTDAFSAPTFPGQPGASSEAYRWSGVLGSTWAFRPNMVNELLLIDRVGFTDFIEPARVAGPMYNATSSLWTNPLDPTFPSGRGSPQKEITDDLTFIKGKHTFKTGLSMRFFDLASYSYVGSYPNVTFNDTNGNTVPTTIGPSGSAVISSSNRTIFENLYNNLLGRMDQVTQTFYSNLVSYQTPGSPRRRNFNLTEEGYFFQDDWKIAKHLTFNLGIRYEYFGDPKERNGFQGNYTEANMLSDSTPLSNISVKPGVGWFNTDKNNFAPRFGFAWDPTGNGRTAVRGHFGMFYDRVDSGAQTNIDSAMPGFSSTTPIYPNGAGNTDVRLSDGGAPIPPVPGSITLQLPLTRSQSINVFNPNIKTGYVLEYGLSVQHQFFRNTIVEVGYVGNRGIKLLMMEDLNQLQINNGFLQAFQQIQAYQANGTPVPTGNALVQMFGTPAAVISTLGATNFTNGLVGTAANTLDVQQNSRYAAAGLSQFYLRNYPQFNQVLYGTNDGRSYYDSLQVSVHRQVGAFRLGANYTWSKSMDDGSSDGTSFAQPIDDFNIRLNRARSDFDRPHVFNGTVIYTLPIGRGKTFGNSMPQWADTLIGGWDLGSIITWESGAPFTVSSSRATTGIQGSTWANYTGNRNAGVVSEQGGGVYFFTAADLANFSFPAAGQIGTSGRNTFRGPQYSDIDTSMVKRFKVKEHSYFSFRWECYNLLNHPTFSGLSTNLTTPSTFGKFSSQAGNPRIMQAALRFDF